MTAHQPTHPGGIFVPPAFTHHPPPPPRRSARDWNPGPAIGLFCAGDRRPLYQRITDGIRRQIRDGDLRPGQRLPSARLLACRYGVSVVTAQRALGELQRARLTFSVAGRGTFVHPGALTALHGNAAGRRRLEPPVAQLRAELAAEMAHIARYHDAVTAEEREAALLAHIDWHHQQANSPWKDNHHASD